MVTETSPKKMSLYRNILRKHPQERNFDSLTYGFQGTFISGQRPKGKSNNDEKDGELIMNQRHIGVLDGDRLDSEKAGSSSLRGKAVRPETHLGWCMTFKAIAEHNYANYALFFFGPVSSGSSFEFTVVT